MAKKKPKPKKKYFTIDQANQMLPLVRSIVEDISELAQELIGRQERLAKSAPPKDGKPGDVYEEEYKEMEAEYVRDAVRLEEYVDELRKLGVDIKGWDGIVDFPGQMDGREVCLCWKLGETEVAHWHEVDAGFAGRQPLYAEAVTPGEINYQESED